MSKNSKYTQALIYATKKLPSDVLKIAPKRTTQKTEEVTSDLVGNKILEKITKATTKNTGEYPKKSTTTPILEPINIPKENT